MILEEGRGGQHRVTWATMGFSRTDITIGVLIIFLVDYTTVCWHAVLLSVFKRFVRSM